MEALRSVAQTSGPGRPTGDTRSPATMIAKNGAERIRYPVGLAVEGIERWSLNGDGPSRQTADLQMLSSLNCSTVEDPLHHSCQIEYQGESARALGAVWALTELWDTLGLSA